MKEVNVGEPEEALAVRLLFTPTEALVEQLEAEGTD